ncbi:MAG TPA: alcohol dehydrogenase catalytic domain-containing protein [Candidatus Eisenbacteria bacterium]|nr:alcohol dehydrogenase catalytic domain-containing protein [Candidatus Eisenbacteria bacterium]
MKAVVALKVNAPVVMEDRPIPQPKAGEVLIKVHACGVCHSDLAVLEGQIPFASFPRVLGHEVAGVVDRVGEGVTWPKLGDRVGMPWLFSACGHCDQCVRGAEILCPFQTITGVNQDGGYQEYMIAPALYVAPIPDALDFTEAGPLMCAGLTVFNGMRQAGFRPGQKVAVIGLGGLGHLAVLYAKAMGARVAVISNTPDKQDEAQELGAEYFVNTKTQKAGEALRAWDGGADIVLATAPSSEAATAAIPGLAPDGTLVVLGVGPGNISAMPFDLIGARRRVMGSPSGGRSDVRATLNFSAHNKVLPRITKYPLEDADKALDLMDTGKLRDRAVLVVV